MNKAKPRKRILRNPLKAIRAKCLECCGDSPKEVRLCSDTSCSLHPFRQGTNPFPLRKKPAPRLPRPDNDTPIAAPDPGRTGPKMIQLSLLP